MEIVNDYDIHSETMALLPHFDRFANLNTIVMEENGHFLVPIAPKKVIDESCRYYGSSYEGRLEGVKRVMGISKKAPIAISAELGIFFFPLESPSNASCVWLSHSHIEKVKENDQRQALIVFVNGQSLVAPASRNQVEVKLLRTAQYRHLLEIRTAKKQNYFFYRKREKVEVVRDPARQSYDVKQVVE